MTKNSVLGGYALIAGSTFYLIANGILTPLLPSEASGSELFASTAFLRRLSVASISAFFLLVGSIGLYEHQSARTGRFGAVSFWLLFTGGVLIFAHEWGQVFFLHPLALIAPDALQAIEDVEGPNLYDIEAIVVFISFTMGWILFAISMLVARVFNPLGPMLLIGGFFVTPILVGVVPGLWGFVIGNVVLASGWIILGIELIRSKSLIANGNS